jgi:hypothetical protein
MPADIQFWAHDEDSDVARACVAAARVVDEVTRDRQQEIVDNYALYGVRAATIAYQHLEDTGIAGSPSARRASRARCF